jgi:hypothetical protein
LQLAPAQTALIDAWLFSKHLDVPWMREWATRAVVLASEYLHSQRVKSFGLDAILTDKRGQPEPAYDRTLIATYGSDVFDEWRDDELPPQLGETWNAFRDRMKQSYKRRVDVVGGRLTTKRKLGEQFAQHSSWLARIHVSREPLTAILHDDPDLERSTVLKALKSFRALIELPSETGVN